MIDDDDMAEAEAEWWDYDTAEEMAEAVAGDVAFIIESALDARGECLLALPGGNTPLPIYEKLKAVKLKWKYVTIFPGDDRMVAVDNPLSNVAMLAKTFLPLGGRVVPIASANLGVKQAGDAAEARLRDLKWPPDLVWLGVGGDGHTASIFPGPDYEEALTSKRFAIGVTPDPLPAEAPVPRVTLTRSAILSARAIMFTLSGAAKRKVLEMAIAQGAASPYPVGRLLADIDQPIDIHWSAK
jgi:6-phosphogluconolactonase